MARVREGREGLLPAVPVLGVCLERNLALVDAGEGVRALRIRANKEGVSWDPKVRFTTGCLNTAEKRAIRHGYIEARMRGPDANARGTDADLFLFAAANRWPPEIDIYEVYGAGQARTVLLNHHYIEAGVRKHEEQRFTLTSGTFADGWHTFGLAWQPGLLVWYVDGVERHRHAQHVPAEDMVLFLATEVMGGWTGDPDSGTWPQDHLVDYVRVYEAVP